MLTLALERCFSSATSRRGEGGGFSVEAESNMLASSPDDHAKGVLDAALRGKTDQFVLKLRKPK